MKIGFIVQTLSGGGAERVVSVLSSKFADMPGFEPSVLILFPKDKEYSTNKGVSRIYLFASEKAYRLASKRERIKQIRNAVRANDIKAIFPFLWFVGVYTQVACLGLDVRIIQTIRNNPALVPHSKMARMLRDWTLSISYGVFCQNQEQFDYLPRRVRKKTRVIPNPVAEEFFDLRVEPSKREKIVMFGRLEKQKNYPMMIRAVYSLKKAGKAFSVEIYGEGSLAGELQNEIDCTGLHDVVKLMGRTENPSDVMRDAALFVMTSSFEGMPNSLMEAMAAGLPCISTDCPTGPANLIEDGIDGYLVGVDDDRALSKRIEALMSDADLRCRIGAAGRAKVAALYKPDCIARELASYFLQEDAFTDAHGGGQNQFPV